MTLLTVFTAPKPFTNPHITTIQRNAIQSWIHLGPEVEVYLMGNEEGMSEIAEAFQIRHFPEVKCSEQGTPKISSMIEIARQNSDTPYLGILNADIMLMSDFVEATRQVGAQTKKFLFLGSIDRLLIH